MALIIAPFQPILRPILCEVFPHKLKPNFFRHGSLQRRLLLARVQAIGPVQPDGSRFSTRSGGDRMVSGVRPGARSASSKSLIDDEAELSDWVSGFNSNSSRRTKVYSDSDNDDGGRKSGGFDRSYGAGKRRNSDFGRDSDFTSRRGDGRGGGREFSGNSRGGRGEFSGNSRGGRGGGREFSGNSRGGRGGRGEFSGGSRGGRGGGRDSSEAFPGRRSYENESGGSVFGGRGGGRGSSNFSRGRGGRFGGLSERRERTNGYMSSRGDGERNGRTNGYMSRGNGNGNRGGRSGERGGSMTMIRGGKGVERRGLLVTDDEDLEEDEDDVSDEAEKGNENYMSFNELIDSDEADDDDDEGEEDEEEEVLRAESVKGKSSNEFPKSPSKSSDSYLSESRFDECAVSPLSLKGIKDAGYEKMTMVQEATLPVILKGKDVLAKAKTGTGKTVAFLLPAIEIVAKSHSTGLDQKRPPIVVLIICPTRELATQAATEANKLLKYHPSIGVQVVIGGTRLTMEQKKMQANPCQILVATPGRLRDHIENTSGFATRLMGVQVLVLDEADHLLDMGFRKEIEKIIAAVPKQRQTLLFSATIPQEVRQICHVALKRDHEFINTVQEGSEDTHSQVRQMHLVVPLDKHFSLLYTLLKEHIADDVNYKVLVFCTTAMMTKLVAELLNELNLNVREIHSRKPQSYRTRVSEEFRKSTGLILVTSDVSARGVDYPDVTLVVQIGVPADKQQYIHRLGRTGRKGKEGQGILLLAPWEEFFLFTVKDLPISKATEPLVDPDTKKKVERALSHVEMKTKESAYQAWLGYYNSNKSIGRDKYKLVELANEFSRTMCLDNPPAIPKLVLGKMGLKNIPGLRSK